MSVVQPVEQSATKPGEKVLWANNIQKKKSPSIDRDSGGGTAHNRPWEEMLEDDMRRFNIERFTRAQAQMLHSTKLRSGLARARQKLSE